MTLPKVARVFFAIDLPDFIKQAIGKFISTLKKNSKSSIIRWTRPENLHITLQFLSEVKGSDIHSLINEVRSQIQVQSQRPALTLKLGKIHLFPNPYRPRVIVLDIVNQDEITELAAMVGQGIEKLNYPRETRPFRAHLTLGRIKLPQSIDLDFLSKTTPPEFDQIPFSEVVLFRSEPQPQGSQYTIIEKISWI